MNAQCLTVAVDPTCLIVNQEQPCLAVAVDVLAEGNLLLSWGFGVSLCEQLKKGTFSLAHVVNFNRFACKFSFSDIVTAFHICASKPLMSEVGWLCGLCLGPLFCLCPLAAVAAFYLFFSSNSKETLPIIGP